MTSWQPNEAWRRALRHPFDDYTCCHFTDDTEAEQFATEFFTARARNVDHNHSDPCEACEKFIKVARDLARIHHNTQKRMWTAPASRDLLTAAQDELFRQDRLQATGARPGPPTPKLTTARPGHSRT
jgi:hypothetical protein